MLDAVDIYAPSDSNTNRIHVPKQRITLNKIITVPCKVLLVLEIHCCFFFRTGLISR